MFVLQSIKEKDITKKKQEKLVHVLHGENRRQLLQYGCTQRSEGEQITWAPCRGHTGVHIETAEYPFASDIDIDWFEKWNGIITVM